jgi:eukaryotic-like serine/threonine-protein kinase
MLSRSRMPYQTQLRADDPGRVGRYVLAGRIEGIPSDDPIYLATGPDGSEVAISMLARNWAQDGAARDRFAAEAAVAMRVPPFCAARVLDAGTEGDVGYLVSEYIPGQSLMDIVTTAGVLSGVDLEAVAIGMATGLASVHQAGLVHGHFGPEYAILPPSGPVRVVEYAITPPYGPATPSADMLAWAQTVFFAAAGRQAGRQADLDTLPSHLRDLVEQCLNPDPAERPTARAVVTSLIGDATPPAGVLAEGSRRATRTTPGGLSYGDRKLAGSGAAGRGPGHPAGPAAARRGTNRPVSQRSQPRQVTGQRLVVPRREAGVGSSAGYPPDRGGAGSRPQRSGSHQQPHRRRRAGIWTGAVLVVVVLAGAVLLHLTQNNAGGRSPRSGLGSPTAATASAPTIPAAFIGTWRGRITQPPDDVYTVTITLVTVAGPNTVSYSGDLTCSGSLELTQATSSKLVMSQAQCPSGTVILSLAGTRSIRFSFSKGGSKATGTLTKH